MHRFISPDSCSREECIKSYKHFYGFFYTFMAERANESKILTKMMLSESLRKLNGISAYLVKKSLYLMWLASMIHKITSVQILALGQERDE